MSNFQQITGFFSLPSGNYNDYKNTVFPNNVMVHMNDTHDLYLGDGVTELQNLTPFAKTNADAGSVMHGGTVLDHQGVRRLEVHPTYNGDLNNITSPGPWDFLSTDTHRPSSFTGPGVVVVSSGRNGQRLCQIAYPLSTTGNPSFRVSVDGGSNWSNWSALSISGHTHNYVSPSDLANNQYEWKAQFGKSTTLGTSGTLSWNPDNFPVGIIPSLTGNATLDITPTDTTHIRNVLIDIRHGVNPSHTLAFTCGSGFSISWDNDTVVDLQHGEARTTLSAVILGQTILISPFYIGD